MKLNQNKLLEQRAQRLTWWTWQRYLVSPDDVACFVLWGLFLGFLGGFVLGVIWF